MPEFVVKHVPSDKASLWKERWPERGEATSRASRADKDGALGQTEIVHAKTEKQAREIIEKKYPGHRITGVDRVR